MLYTCTFFLLIYGPSPETEENAEGQIIVPRHAIYIFFFVYMFMYVSSFLYIYIFDTNTNYIYTAALEDLEQSHPWHKTETASWTVCFFKMYIYIFLESYFQNYIYIYIYEYK